MLPMSVTESHRNTVPHVFYKKAHHATNECNRKSLQHSSPRVLQAMLPMSARESHCNTVPHVFYKKARHATNKCNRKSSQHSSPRVLQEGSPCYQ